MTATRRAQKREIPRLVGAFLALGILLMGQLQLSLAQGMVLGDLMLITVIAWWVMASGNDGGRELGRRLFPPLLFVLIGSLIALAPNGLPSWGVRDLALDLSAIFTFLAVYAVASQADKSQWAALRRATIASLVIVTVLLVRSGSGELRDSGSFPNPNVAGHFAVTVTATLLCLAVSRRQRWGVGIVGATAWAVSGSFGALLQASAMTGYFLWQRQRRARTVVLIGIMIGLMSMAWMTLPTGDRWGSVTFAGVSTGRLRRSSDGRLGLWADGFHEVFVTPWGAGPGAVHALGISTKELHNEMLAYLVERGPLALVGLVLVVATLWRYANRDGPARTLLIGFVVASFFRETSHYRHLWISLALVLALESRQQLHRTPEDSEGPSRQNRDRANQIGRGAD